MSISQEIDNKISIVDLTSRYLSIKKAGVNYKALCPFHNEKTASFVISPAKNIAYCFSCHTGGGPVKFLSEIEKIPYGEAVQKLAVEAGIELKTNFYKEHKENRGNLYDLHKIVTEEYQKELFKEENIGKLKYLLDRGLSLETIKNFKLGYSGDPRSLFYKLKEKGFEEKDIIDSGIFVSAFKDKFFGRIVFPITDFTGNVVAFTGRVLDKSLPKYLNSPTTKIYEKSSILYGLSLAKSSIAKKGFVIIVEGQMDTISLHQAGFTNTIAISGTALTEEQIKLLKRLTKKIYLSLDGDNAGILATFLSLENTINSEVDIKIINFGESKDPDEYLKSGQDFEKAIENALSPISFYLKEGSKKYDIKSMQGKKSIIKDIFQLLKKMHSKIEVDMHLKEISGFLGVSMDVLYEEFKSTKMKVIQKEEQDIIDTKPFDIYEEITAYLNLYNFFDLFLQNFEYNLDNIKSGDSLAILKKAILHKEGFFEDSSIDVDKLKTVELFIEESNANLNEDAINKKFLDLVFKLQKNIFEEEWRELNEQFKKEPNNLDLYKKIHSMKEYGSKKGFINKGTSGNFK